MTKFDKLINKFKKNPIAYLLGGFIIVYFLKRLFTNKNFGNFGSGVIDFDDQYTSVAKALGGYIYGDNYIFVYPDEVNSIITGLNKEDLQKVATKYKKIYKISLLENLKGEWGFFGSYYQDSINYLESNGIF